MNGFPADDPRSYDRISQYVKNALDEWGKTGHPVGGFLSAVLSNNLSEAVGRADLENLWAIPAIVAYLYNEVPGACWGSPAKVKAWPKLVKNGTGG